MKTEADTTDTDRLLKIVHGHVGGLSIQTFHRNERDAAPVMEVKWKDGAVIADTLTEAFLTIIGHFRESQRTADRS